jgi:methyl-accepting chemotaxis protein
VKFRRRGVATLVVAAVVSLLSILLVANFLVNKLLTSAHEADYELMRQVFASVSKTTEEKALVRAEIVESMPTVHDAFLKRDRERLLNECKGMYAEQSEKYGLDQAQFHTPGGVSFLRLHKPAVFGDEQSSYRPMLADVHQHKAVRKGIVITRAGPAITAIIPVFDDQRQFAGSFEMGLELEPMFEKIKEAYHLESAIFLEEKQLREIATDMPGELLSPKNRVGKYIRYHSTNPELLAALVADKDVETMDARHYERSVHGSPWGVQLLPIYNYAGKQIGVVALGTNLGDDKAATGRARVWMGLTTLFALVFLLGVILISVRGMILSPVESLGRRMAALAQGDTTQPADELDSYCDEVRVSAEAYERLRHRLGGGG